MQGEEPTLNEQGEEPIEKLCANERGDQPTNWRAPFPKDRIRSRLRARGRGRPTLFLAGTIPSNGVSLGSHPTNWRAPFPKDRNGNSPNAAPKTRCEKCEPGGQPYNWRAPTQALVRSTNFKQKKTKV